MDIRPEEIEEQGDLLNEKGFKCVVVNGIFSPIDRQYQQEERVAEIIKKRIPDAFVVLSKDGKSIFLSRRISRSTFFQVFDEFFMIISNA